MHIPLLITCTHTHTHKQVAAVGCNNLVSRARWCSQLVFGLLNLHPLLFSVAGAQSSGLPFAWACHRNVATLTLWGFVTLHWCLGVMSFI